MTGYRASACRCSHYKQFAGILAQPECKASNKQLIRSYP